MMAGCQCAQCNVSPPDWYSPVGGNGAVGGGCCLPGQMLQCNGLWCSNSVSQAAGAGVLTWNASGVNWTRFKPQYLFLTAQDVAALGTRRVTRGTRLTTLTYLGTNFLLNALGVPFVFADPESARALRVMEIGEVNSGGANVTGDFVNGVATAFLHQGYLVGWAKRG